MMCGGACICVGEVILKWIEPEFRAWDCGINWCTRERGFRLKIENRATWARFWQTMCGGAQICLGVVLLKWGKSRLRAWNCRIEWCARGVGFRLKIESPAAGAWFWRTTCGGARICLGVVLLKWGESRSRAWNCGIEWCARGMGFRLKVENQAAEAQFWPTMCGGAWERVGGVLLKWGKPGLRAWNCAIEWCARGVGFGLKVDNWAARAQFLTGGG